MRGHPETRAFFFFWANLSSNNVKGTFGMAGFIFWALAYYHLNKHQLWNGPKRTILTILNIIIFALGLFMLGPGLYTSIEAIKIDYSGAVRKPFTCATNSL